MLLVVDDADGSVKLYDVDILRSMLDTFNDDDGCDFAVTWWAGANASAAPVTMAKNIEILNRFIFRYSFQIFIESQSGVVLVKKIWFVFVLTQKREAFCS